MIPCSILLQRARAQRHLQYTYFNMQAQNPTSTLACPQAKRIKRTKSTDTHLRRRTVRQIMTARLDLHFIPRPRVERARECQEAQVPDRRERCGARNISAAKAVWHHRPKYLQPRLHMTTGLMRKTNAQPPSFTHSLHHTTVQHTRHVLCTDAFLTTYALSA